MLTIPLAAVPSQTLSVTVAGQNCRFALYQRGAALYCDLSVSGRAIITGCACRDRTLMVRSAYLGFIGDVAIIDTQGSSNPVYTGLGSRFSLVYFTPDELIPFQVA